MAANMMLDTSHNIQQVKKMVCKILKLHIGAKIDIFAFSHGVSKGISVFCDLRENGWV